MTAPTLDKRWTVSYRFGNFKQFRAALGADAAVITAAFPKDALKSKFGVLGVRLGEDENRQRAALLDAWICEVNDLSPGCGRGISSFVEHWTSVRGERCSSVLTPSGRSRRAPLARSCPSDRSCSRMHGTSSADS